MEPAFGARGDLVLALTTERLSAACRAALPEPSSKLTVHSRALAT
jgi:hypothetical protein